MSKIHEALKKAREEESQWGVPGQPAVPLPPLPATQEMTNAARRLEKQPVTPGHARSGISGQYLRFEDLLTQCAEPVWQPDANAIVFSQSYATAQGAEHFRTLRTRLYQIRNGSPLKKILVTSAVGGEGKTFVATNLAQAFMCERERKVLLIDGDLRRASLHLPLGAPVAPGLAEYLRDEASEAEIIQHGQAGNLCFIAGGMGGGTNASELFSNGRVQKLLDRVGPLFDWVILDSAPCLPVADASVLAGFADGLLLVVRAKSTPAVMVQKARQELLTRNLIGVVLNGVDDSATYGGYFDYAASDSRKPIRKQLSL